LYDSNQFIKAKKEYSWENRIKVPIPNVKQEKYKKDCIEMMCIVEDFKLSPSNLGKRSDPND